MYSNGYDRHRALKTNLISKTIEVSNGLQLARDLRQIQRLTQAGLTLSIEVNFQPGSKVRIKSGPLSGVEGIVVKKQGAEFLFVAVNFLQQGALIRLEGDQVVPVI